MFNQGSFRALPANREGQPISPPVPLFVGPAPAGYSEWYFAQAGLDTSLVDLRRPAASAPVTAWLGQARPTRQIGALFSRDNPELSARSFPLTDFDGLIYIPTSTPAVPAQP